MNTLTFTKHIQSIGLPKQHGTAAFDPVTLCLAAEKFAANMVSIALPAAFQADRPDTFGELAEITLTYDGLGRPMVVAVIDTGCMGWADSVQKKASVFLSYEGKKIKAVEFASAQVASKLGKIITTIPMVLPNGDYVSAWFMELEHELDNLDGLALVQMVKEAERLYSDPSAVSMAKVHIPQFEIKYETFINDSVQCVEPVMIKQEFLGELDVEGARVKAKTIMMKGTAMRTTESEHEIYFGAKGPVLWWLSTSRTTPEVLPFAIIYTESDAWLAA